MPGPFHLPPRPTVSGLNVRPGDTLVIKGMRGGNACFNGTYTVAPVDPMNLAAYGQSRPHTPGPMAPPGLPWVGKGKRK